MEEREVEELVPDDVKEPRLVHQTVDNELPLPLWLEGAEDSVPDGEPAAIVLVQTIPVSKAVSVLCYVSYI